MFKHLLNLFFPNICYSCGDSITDKLNHICFRCRVDLPRIIQDPNFTNPIERIFQGRVRFEKTCSFLRFQNKNKTQKLLHHLKYRGVKEIGTTLGELAAIELKDTGIFNQVDLIIPLPIHEKKMKQRGYNQSEYVAKGLSNITDIHYANAYVKKIIHTESQTKKSRFKRWKNVESSFIVNQIEMIRNKHILLVDDVVTTGATAESCGNEILKVEGAKLNFLSIACAY